MGSHTTCSHTRIDDALKEIVADDKPGHNWNMNIFFFVLLLIGGWCDIMKIELLPARELNLQVQGVRKSAMRVFPCCLVFKSLAESICHDFLWFGARIQAPLWHRGIHCLGIIFEAPQSKISRKIVRTTCASNGLPGGPLWGHWAKAKWPRPKTLGPGTGTKCCFSNTPLARGPAFFFFFTFYVIVWCILGISWYIRGIVGV